MCVYADEYGYDQWYCGVEDRCVCVRESLFICVCVCVNLSMCVYADA